jgi:coenzyme PQQ biosynthesis protein PqqD
MIATSVRPRLAPKVRLRLDRKSERFMLLYPERGMVLNPTAAEIVKRCTGELTVTEIIAALVAQYGEQSREAIERETVRLLDTMAERGLVGSEP